MAQRTKADRSAAAKKAAATRKRNQQRAKSSTTGSKAASTRQGKKSGASLGSAKQGVGTAISDMLQDMGLIARAMGDSLAFCPPLIITADEINQMFDIVERGLDRLEERVGSENLRAA